MASFLGTNVPCVTHYAADSLNPQSYFYYYDVSGLHLNTVLKYNHLKNPN